MLDEHGALLPAGAWIDSLGTLGFVGAQDGDDEYQVPSKVLELLYAAMIEKAARGGIRAAAVCVDVRVERPSDATMTDAVMVSIEHADADPVNVFLPYAKRRFGRSVEYGDLFAQERERKIFVQ